MIWMETWICFYSNHAVSIKMETVCAPGKLCRHFRPTVLSGDRIFRNDGAMFSLMLQSETGINSSAISFGLRYVLVADINLRWLARPVYAVMILTKMTTYTSTRKWNITRRNANERLMRTLASTLDAVLTLLR